MRTHHIIFSVSLAVAVSCVASPAVAQGAVGGTVGKTNRSVSGDVNTPPALRQAKPKQPREPSEAKTAGCGNLAGVWTAVGWWNGMYGRGDVTLNADGTARHVSGINGNWTCSSKKFTINWTNWASGEGTLTGNSVVDNSGKTMMVRGR